LTYDHHHPRFDVDEQCLRIGAEVLLETARRYLAS
jgi:metal-dependent amidase/aminoacylase/carboxypeptidase family protein